MHEFPPLISSKPPKSDSVLKAGNVLSNEPGYYKDGDFGIRIENVMTVVPSSKHKGFLEFETISYVPIQSSLIDVDILSEKGLMWINNYHERCREKVGPKLQRFPRALKWFQSATKPLKRCG